MKSLSNRGIHRWSDGSATIARVSPLHDKYINAARKFVTEFVDIGGHVGIIRSSVWQDRAAGVAASAKFR